MALETVSVPIAGKIDHVTPGTFVPRTVAWKDVDPPAERDAEEGVIATVIRLVWAVAMAPDNRTSPAATDRSLTMISAFVLCILVLLSASHHRSFTLITPLVYTHLVSQFSHNWLRLLHIPPFS